jgi:Icc-related predicted phosphoesterase
VESKNRSLIKNATLLVNSGVVIEGIRIWGSPVTPLPGVAFGMPDAAERKKLWAKIPTGTDILITHCPPYGILDQETGSELHQGCHELREALLRVRPRLHVFGHVHGGYGTLQTADTYFVNAALYDKLNDVEPRPIVVHDFRAR